MGWTIAEDSFDRYVIHALEEHDTGIRTFGCWPAADLNPSRSFANVMTGQLPWHRDDRRACSSRIPRAAAAKTAIERVPQRVRSTLRPGWLRSNSPSTPSFTDRMWATAPRASCVGGSGTIAFRVASEWQIVIDVNGCKMLDLPTNLSGDSLTYMVGPRWTPPTTGHWNRACPGSGGRHQADPGISTRMRSGAYWAHQADEGDLSRPSYYTKDLGNRRICDRRGNRRGLQDQ